MTVVRLRRVQTDTRRTLTTVGALVAFSALASLPWYLVVAGVSAASPTTSSSWSWPPLCLPGFVHATVTYDVVYAATTSGLAVVGVCCCAVRVLRAVLRCTTAVRPSTSGAGQLLFQDELQTATTVVLLVVVFVACRCVHCAVAVVATRSAARLRASLTTSCVCRAMVTTSYSASCVAYVVMQHLRTRASFYDVVRRLRHRASFRTSRRRRASLTTSCDVYDVVLYLRRRPSITTCVYYGVLRCFVRRLRRHATLVTSCVAYMVIFVACRCVHCVFVGLAAWVSVTSGGPTNRQVLLDSAAALAVSVNGAINPAVYAVRNPNVARVLRLGRQQRYGGYVAEDPASATHVAATGTTTRQADLSDRRAGADQPPAVTVPQATNSVGCDGENSTTMTYVVPADCRRRQETDADRRAWSADFWTWRRSSRSLSTPSVVYNAASRRKSSQSSTRTGSTLTSVVL